MRKMNKDEIIDFLVKEYNYIDESNNLNINKRKYIKNYINHINSTGDLDFDISNDKMSIYDYACKLFGNNQIICLLPFFFIGKISALSAFIIFFIMGVCCDKCKKLYNIKKKNWVYNFNLRESIAMNKYIKNLKNELNKDVKDKSKVDEYIDSYKEDLNNIYSNMNNNSNYLSKKLVKIKK